MVVCLIIEGAYPYVVGGVSSWTHRLIINMPNTKFKILSIMPSKKKEYKIEYELPNNVVEFKTLYLDEYIEDNEKKFIRDINLKNIDYDELKNFMMFNPESNMKVITKLFRNKRKIGKINELIKSKAFYNILIDLYDEKYENHSFNEYFWMMRSMYLPIFEMLYSELIEADIYHSISTGYAGLIGVMAKYIYNKPLILTEHGIYAREREEEILKSNWIPSNYKITWIDFFYFLSQITYSNANHIISLFERNCDIQISLGADESKTSVIPNGIEVSKFEVEKVKHDKFIIGAIVRVVPIKDIVTMIKAFYLVTKKMDNVELHIIGPTDEDEEYFDICKRYINVFNISDKVKFTGKVNVIDYYKIIDLLILTSVSEGQPLVILEAMAAKVPIMSTDVGACREMLTGDKYEDDCGIIVKMINPIDISNKIIEIINNYKNLKYMGENGSKRVKRKYNLDLVIAKYNNLYNKMHGM